MTWRLYVFKHIRNDNTCISLKHHAWAPKLEETTLLEQYNVLINIMSNQETQFSLRQLWYRSVNLSDIIDIQQWIASYIAAEKE